jgi:hypothetical protein
VSFDASFDYPTVAPPFVFCLLRCAKSPACKPFALYFLPDHSATSPLFCISYRKTGSGLSAISQF